MESVVKHILRTKTLTKTNYTEEGCISKGSAYKTDHGIVFIKQNTKLKARLMFDGEFEGLSAIAATNTVAVPKPIKVLDNPDGGACLVMEFLEMKGLRRFSAHLGDSLAKMHLHNESLRNSKDSGHVKEFGFHTPTCCGYIPQDNTWKEDWVLFFAQNRLDHQFRLLEKEKGDREANELWSRLQIVLPTFFKDLEIKPSLLHGDLWGGNAAETKTNPVIFDPATFYGHHEYDLAIAGMFGGFNRSFYDAYHKIIPKAAGFENRHKLYQLFHYLNHWNHFGSGYRGSTISTMKSLLK
ncbi:ketosamine-3-kinase-like isoform X2 [Macrosteles quadrilineatus]|uniref:ketosamine-3-kinase-like isoform X2 n=1 Tax=Macrosteles quadrilineatus TaxID=74068 RepID=UPI0023E32EA5|nr:ketosamine-3-kinase-like isoform X2 [Macrosteles quadrilineatus]